MGERPHTDPPTDSLTTLGEAERDAALRRFEALPSIRASAESCAGSRLVRITNGGSSTSPYRVEGPGVS